MEIFRKTLYSFSLFFILGTYVACNQSKLTSPENSTGGFDEIIVVADGNDLNAYLKNSLQKTFRGAYEVMPQHEPVYDARIISFADFDKFFQKFRTIVIVANLEKNDPVTRFVIEEIGEENTAKALNNSDFNLAVKKNLWAKPQLVIFLFARSKDDLAHLLEKKSKQIIDFVSRNELEKFKNNIYMNGLNHELTERLKKEANINLPIPKNFVLALQGDKFYWLRNIGDDFDNNIMISWMDISDTIIDPVEWRNALGKNISTKIDSSYMTSDTILPFYTNTFSINSLQVHERRGLWKMVNDFMGGPFITYLIVDEKQNRLILLDGFVYAPGEKNKPHLRKLEAIFHQYGRTDVNI